MKCNFVIPMIFVEGPITGFYVNPRQPMKTSDLPNNFWGSGAGILHIIFDI
jgi:hypothetical protein